MPASAPRPCTYPGCGVLVQGGARCPKHLNAERKQADERRGTAHERGYSAAWRRARLGFLLKHPLCVECAAANVTRLATVVDHKAPHKGDKALFWERSNWQGLCKPHHDRKTALEDGGFGRDAG